MTGIHRATALAMMLAFLAMSTLGAGWVVCSGADGHVEIESLTTGCCGDDASDDQGTDEKDCGECDDVLLAQLSPARVAGDEVPDLEAPVTAPTFVAASLVDAWSARSVMQRAPPAPPGPPPLARHLASTVLRN